MRDLLVNKNVPTEEIEGVAVKLSYGGFDCLIQLPKVLPKLYEEIVSIDLPEGHPDYR